MTREEAIKKLQRHKAEYLDKWVDFSGITEALDMAIKALEQKTGEWVSEIVDAEDWKGIKRRCYQPTSCSVCHKPCAIEYPYCPRCGAKMRTEAESEDS